MRTDRLDAEQLLAQWLRHVGGERTALRVVRVPSDADEQRRQLQREHQSLTRDRVRVLNRIKGLGIGKAGNRAVRAIATQIAWGWLRFQPQSALTRWYQDRFAGGGPRARRIGIAAVARRLLMSDDRVA